MISSRLKIPPNFGCDSWTNIPNSNESVSLPQIKTPNDSTGTGGETLDADADTPASNGSIITMTLKNNHLIVETEERNVSS